MTEAQKKAKAYASETILSGKTPEEIAYISYHAGWVECEAKVNGLISALENCREWSKFYFQKQGDGLPLAYPNEDMAEQIHDECANALAAYRSEKDEERMEGIHLP